MISAWCSRDLLNSELKLLLEHRLANVLNECTPSLLDDATGLHHSWVINWTERFRCV